MLSFKARLQLVLKRLYTESVFSVGILRGCTSQVGSGVWSPPQLVSGCAVHCVTQRFAMFHCVSGMRNTRTIIFSMIRFPALAERAN